MKSIDKNEEKVTKENFSLRKDIEMYLKPFLDSSMVFV